jgi:hypothetical protein
MNTPDFTEAVSPRVSFMGVNSSNVVNVSAQLVPAPSVESANNIGVIKDEFDTTKTGEYITRTTPNGINTTSGAGEITTFPKSTEVVEFSNVSGYSETKTVDSTNYEGITSNKINGVDDLTKIAATKEDIVNAKENIKVDGAAKIGDPGVKGTVQQ